MSTKSKQKPPRNAIVLEDVVFKLGVQDVKGTIHGQQGVTCFISEEEKLVIPLTFSVPLEMYEEEVTACVRTCDESLVLEMGEDDVYIDDLDEEEGEVDVTNPSVISEMFEEQKLRVLPQVIMGVVYTIGCLIAFIVTLLLKVPLFPYVCIIACIGVWCLIWSIKWYSQLNKSIAYDANGNWIDMETGRTSLNGGTFRYKVEARE